MIWDSTNITSRGYELGPFSLGVVNDWMRASFNRYLPTGLLRGGWEEQTADRFVVDSGRRYLHAAVDGEPVVLRRPIEFRVEPQALRVLVPQSHDHAHSLGPHMPS